MKRISWLAGCFILLSFVTWQSSFEKAKQVAKEKHRLIMLNFSGSDWCGPCIRMRKEIFDSEVFSAMADTTLAMVNADFPRNKKNQLEKSLQTQNEMLADTYNAAGKFPLTALLDENGKLLKSWDGLPNETAAQFTADIRAIADTRK